MTPQVSYVYSAQVVKVTDGDTIVVDADLGFRVHQVMSLRLRGINAPEKKGATYLQGLASTTALAGLLAPHPTILIETYRDASDKYGRFLAILYIENGDGTKLNVNQWMIDSGHAIPYMTG